MITDNQIINKHNIYYTLSASLSKWYVEADFLNIFLITVIFLPYSLGLKASGPVFNNVIRMIAGPSEPSRINESIFLPLPVSWALEPKPNCNACTKADLPIYK